MPTINVYKQARIDGGVRIGADVDDQEMLHEFTRGATESDPALEWYVDVHCEGPAVPDTPDTAREWLRSLSPDIKAGLASVADELHAGIDVQSFPVHRTILTSPDAQVEVVCSAIRRLAARDIANRLRDFAQEWDAIVSRITTPVSAE